MSPSHVADMKKEIALRKKVMRNLIRLLTNNAETVDKLKKHVELLAKEVNIIQEQKAILNKQAKTKFK